MNLLRSIREFARQGTLRYGPDRDSGRQEHASDQLARRWTPVVSQDFVVDTNSQKELHSQRQKWDYASSMTSCTSLHNKHLQGRLHVAHSAAHVLALCRGVCHPISAVQCFGLCMRQFFVCQNAEVLLGIQLVPPPLLSAAILCSCTQRHAPIH